MSPKETPAVSAPLSLRERKKLKTLRTIRREAFRLFAEQGYEATTVDQIADAAEVSPSTFFRYFPTKEDVVLDDDYNPAMAEALRARPADEPVIESIRQALTDSVGELLQHDREELMIRTRLTYNDPAIRARSMDELVRSEAEVAAMIADRTGRPESDLEIRCAAAAIIAVSSAVIRHWVEGDGQENLSALYDTQLGLLAAGLRL
ncbi:acyl-CoA-like ligand-binding transcription factor [Streptomyces sp. NBC_01465]|uniref:acyl-CoA-like ligand-binding transcription factor n=1 Tax=Streptomyces sp. NBC_01465 TaxID=2903878 RepID=UPI002E3115CC|nr:TetR family transcriptional regulator [Streptomyces sp. NBC_01465]